MFTYVENGNNKYMIYSFLGGLTMAVERSFVIIKPDGVERNLIGKILEVYEGAGLKVVAMRMEKISKELAEQHYEEHKNQPFFIDLIQYITRSRLLAIVLEGENAISKIRKLNGATNPQNAEFGTIRKRFAISKSENTVHASDSIESARREIELWFPQ